MALMPPPECVSETPVPADVVPLIWRPEGSVPDPVVPEIVPQFTHCTPLTVLEFVVEV